MKIEEVTVNMDVVYNHDVCQVESINGLDDSVDIFNDAIDDTICVSVDDITPLSEYETVGELSPEFKNIIDGFNKLWSTPYSTTNTAYPASPETEEELDGGEDFEDEISFNDLAEVLYEASLPDDEDTHELTSSELVAIASDFGWQKEALQGAYPNGFTVIW